MTITNHNKDSVPTLEACPLAHPVVNGVRFTNFSNDVKSHIWCYDCGLEFEGRIYEPRDQLAQRWNSRFSANGVAPTVGERLKTYADGYCAQCSELAYPLTRALEKTGVPTGADNWQQTYGPNKVRALADLETCLRRLLNALEEGTPEEIKSRVDWAKHYIELHAAVRRRLTALAQGRDSAAATTATSVEHNNGDQKSTPTGL